MKAKFRLLATVLVLALAGSSAFAAPKARDVVSAPDPDPEVVLADVGFIGAENSRIYVNLAPKDNRPFILMLDTGAAFSVLTPSMARELGVNVRPQKTSPYRRPTVLDRDLQFWVDTSSSDTGGDTFSYGLLGGNFLEEYIVEFDFTKNRIRFLDRRKYVLPKSVSADNESVGRIQIISGRPHVTIERNGEKVSALLDTGAPPALIFTKESREKLGFGEDELEPGVRIWGVRGPSEGFALDAEGLTVAGVDSGRMPATVTDSDYNQGGNRGAIVGFDWMKQFTIRIDYRRSRMWLRREIPVAEVKWLDWMKEIAASEADDPKDIPDPDPIVTEGEKTEIRASAAASDQAQLDRWKTDTETAVYKEVEGGWLRVDGYRRRNGPKEGEVWFSFDEMQALKAERAAEAETSP